MSKIIKVTTKRILTVGLAVSLMNFSFAPKAMALLSSDGIGFFDDRGTPADTNDDLRVIADTSETANAPAGTVPKGGLSVRNSRPVFDPLDATRVVGGGLGLITDIADPNPNFIFVVNDEGELRATDSDGVLTNLIGINAGDITSNDGSVTVNIVDGVADLSVGAIAGGGINAINSPNGTIEVTNPNGPATSLDVAANSITANEIADAAIGTAQLAAGAVTVSSGVFDFDADLIPSVAGANIGSDANPVGDIVATNIGSVTTPVETITANDLSLSAATLRFRGDGGQNTAVGLDGADNFRVDVGDDATNELTLDNLGNATFTGNVSSALFIGNLQGNADTATLATTAVNFTGNLVGDVIGTQDATDIAAGAVDNDELAADAVTTDKILDGTITNADLADGAVNSAKIEDESITADDIQDGSLSLADINIDGAALGEIPTITDDGNGNLQLTFEPNAGGGAGGGINAINSPNGTIEVTNPNGPAASLDVAADSITANEIADGAVDTDQLADGAVTVSSGKFVFDADILPSVAGLNIGAAGNEVNEIHANDLLLASTTLTFRGAADNTELGLDGNDSFVIDAGADGNDDLILATDGTLTNNGDVTLVGGNLNLDALATVDGVDISELQLTVTNIQNGADAITLAGDVTGDSNNNVIDNDRLFDTKTIPGDFVAAVGNNPIAVGNSIQEAFQNAQGSITQNATDIQNIVNGNTPIDPAGLDASGAQPGDLLIADADNDGDGEPDGFVFGQIDAGDSIANNSFPLEKIDLTDAAENDIIRVRDLDQDGTLEIDFEELIVGLGDIDTTGAVNGDILVFDAAQDTFIFQDAATAAGGVQTVTGDATIIATTVGQDVTLTAGLLQNANIADDAIDAAKLADGSVPVSGGAFVFDADLIPSVAGLNIGAAGNEVNEIHANDLLLASSTLTFRGAADNTELGLDGNDSFVIDAGADGNDDLILATDGTLTNNGDVTLVGGNLNLDALATVDGVDVSELEATVTNITNGTEAITLAGDVTGDSNNNVIDNDRLFDTKTIPGDFVAAVGNNPIAVGDSIQEAFQNAQGSITQNATDIQNIVNGITQIDLVDGSVTLTDLDTTGFNPGDLIIADDADNDGVVDGFVPGQIDAGDSIANNSFPLEKIDLTDAAENDIIRVRDLDQDGTLEIDFEELIVGLGDIDTTGAVNGDILVFDAAQDTFIFQDAATAAGGIQTVTGDATIIATTVGQDVTLTAGLLQNANIADDAIDAAKLADGSVPVSGGAFVFDADLIPSVAGLNIGAAGNEVNEIHANDLLLASSTLTFRGAADNTELGLDGNDSFVIDAGADGNDDLILATDGTLTNNGDVTLVGGNLNLDALATVDGVDVSELEATVTNITNGTEAITLAGDVTGDSNNNVIDNDRLFDTKTIPGDFVAAVGNNPIAVGDSIQEAFQNAQGSITQNTTDIQNIVNGNTPINPAGLDATGAQPGDLLIADADNDGDGEPDGFVFGQIDAGDSIANNSFPLEKIDLTDAEDQDIIRIVDNAGTLEATFEQLIVGLGDIDTTGAVDGDILVFDQAQDTFIFQDAATAAGGIQTVTGDATIIATTVGQDVTLTAGVMQTGNIADDAITQTKIADDAVGTDEIADGGVENVDIATASVAATPDSVVVRDANGNIEGAGFVIDDSVNRTELTINEDGDLLVNNEEVVTVNNLANAETRLIDTESVTLVGANAQNASVVSAGGSTSSRVEIANFFPVVILDIANNQVVRGSQTIALDNTARLIPDSNVRVSLNGTDLTFVKEDNTGINALDQDIELQLFGQELI